MLNARSTLWVVAGLGVCLLPGCRTANIEQGYKELENNFVVDAMTLLDKTVSEDVLDIEGKMPNRIPRGFRPWWADEYDKTLLSGRKAQNVRIEKLVPAALSHSFQVGAFADIPLIRETTIAEAKGAFETRVFMQGRVDDINEPVGSTLRTGGEAVYTEDSYSVEAGIKKKVITGGQVKISQEIGAMDSNSAYFDPKEQAKTKLSASFVQPLLSGAGREFNESQTTLAILDSKVGYTELRRQSESFILELYHAYWSLYLERTYLVQKRRLAENTRTVVAALKDRSGVDTLGSQLARAQSDYLSAKADIVKAEKAVRNAESRLRTLTNIPLLYQTSSIEFIPTSELEGTARTINLAAAVTAGLMNRPELEELLLQSQASAIREHVARNQKMPTLNLTLEAYYEGLAGDYDYNGALDGQSSADPSYMAGVVFEMPLSSKAARARHLRRQLEQRQLKSKLRTTAETIVLEIQMSAREVESAYRELQVHYENMMACQTEYDDLSERRSVVLEGGAKGSEYLERLLGSMQRLCQAENSFALSRVTYQLAHWNLVRAKGSLLKKCNIQIVEDEQDGIRLLKLQVADNGQ